MTSEHQALSSPTDIEQLADQISAAADALHTRLLRAIRKGEAAGGIDQESAQAMFEQEVALRQQANGLYTDAAVLVVQGLDASQQHIVALTARAGAQIATMLRIADAADIVGDLLGLAAGAARANPVLIIKALEALKHDSERAAARQAPPA